MPTISRRFGSNLTGLRGGALRDLRPGAAELSDVAIRTTATLTDPQAEKVRLEVMEKAWEAIKGSPGFDPTVAGSASFKLKW